MGSGFVAHVDRIIVAGDINIGELSTDCCARAGRMPITTMARARNLSTQLGKLYMAIHLFDRQTRSREPFSARML